jgi:peptidoglycan-associated lipoprotein
MLLFGMLSLLCSIETTYSSSTTIETQAESHTRFTQTDWYLFGGIGAGYASVHGDEFQDAIKGPQYLLSGGISYEGSQYLFDASLGWLYNNLSGTTATQQPVAVRTRAGFAELAPRYRIDSHWQIGPAFSLLFGTDTTLAPSAGQTAASALAGLKIAYELSFDGYPFRITQQVMTDVAIKGRQGVFAVLGAQFGIPFLKEPREVRHEPRAEAISAIKKSPATVKIELDPQKVFFGTNSSLVKPRVRKLLGEIGDYLNQNKQDWDALEVDGHADQRGRYQYNLRLSRSRAGAVQESLHLTSALSSRVKAQGFSYSKLLDPRNNKEAWSKNRRVELTFSGVRDPLELSKKFEPLKMAATPEQK